LSERTSISGDGAIEYVPPTEKITHLAASSLPFFSAPNPGDYICAHTRVGTKHSDTHLPVEKLRPIEDALSLSDGIVWLDNNCSTQ